MNHNLYRVNSLSHCIRAEDKNQDKRPGQGVSPTIARYRGIAAPPYLAIVGPTPYNLAMIARAEEIKEKIKTVLTKREREVLDRNDARTSAVLIPLLVEELQEINNKNKLLIKKYLIRNRFIKFLVYKF